VILINFIFLPEAIEFILLVLLILGDNKLSVKDKTPLWLKYVKELFSPFAMMLWAAVIFYFIDYGVSTDDESNLYMGFILTVVILVTA